MTTCSFRLCTTLLFRRRRKGTKNGILMENVKQETTVPEAPASYASTVSPKNESEKLKSKVCWWRRILGWKKKPSCASVTESESADTEQLCSGSEKSDSFHTKEEADSRKEKRKKLWWPSILTCLHNTDITELKDTDGSSQENNSMEVDHTFTMEPLCSPPAARDTLFVEPKTSRIRKACLIPKGKVMKRKCQRRRHCVSSSLRKLRLKKHISRRLKQNQTVQSLQMRVYFRKSWSASKARWSDASTAETDEEELSVSSRSSYTSQTSNSNLLSNSPESLSLESYSSGYVKSSNFKCEQMSPKASVLMEGVQSLDEDDLACLGLPNLGQTCYMNSVLQGLLTLTPFVQEVHNHQQVWQSQPECKIIRGLVKVGFCRFPQDEEKKLQLLSDLKDAVAEFNLEFKDSHQKDAQEFLNSILERLRSLSEILNRVADSMNVSYTCPVDAHIGFQMLSTRSCKTCGVHTTEKAYYVILPLNLVRRGSVRQCIEEFLKETPVKFWCECGAEESSQQKSFLTLPK
ncbi:uncharacterized protein LOC142904525 isoform X2 [Nelusetta ayraudi]|uniref:uncharacterized protein LOC142904525 isoform X2 n=1 Tax=Nelusetta ayraudi TaxID=303726 RepID=UPI003F72246A